jgi:hypothetical protein
MIGVCGLNRKKKTSGRAIACSIVLGPMARLSRAMTMKLQRPGSCRVILAPMGLGLRISPHRLEGHPRTWPSRHPVLGSGPGMTTSNDQSVINFAEWHNLYTISMSCRCFALLAVTGSEGAT